MTRKVTSYRLPEMTLNQIKHLAESTGSSDANVIAFAIDRMYQQELNTMNASTKPYLVITHTELTLKNQDEIAPLNGFPYLDGQYPEPMNEDQHIRAFIDLANETELTASQQHFLAYSPHVTSYKIEYH